MKKKNKIIGISLVAIISSILIFDIVERNIMLNKLVQKYEWAEPIRTVRLGRYNGCPAFYYEFVEGSNCKTNSYTIENFTFSIYDYEDVYLLKNNKIYTLEEAYKNGFVTSNQVAIIYLKFGRAEAGGFIWL